MKTRLLAMLLAASSAAFGADWEFDQIVKAIESHYGTERTHIPFMGVANFFVKVAHPAGASGFKLAVFENLQSSSGYRDQADLDPFMSHLSGSGLHPLVRVHSRRNGESTYIYTGEVGKSTKMLIATFERNEATVIQVNVNMHTCFKRSRTRNTRVSLSSTTGKARQSDLRNSRIVSCSVGPKRRKTRAA